MNNNWILNTTALNGTHISQPIPKGTAYTTANNCNVTITVPAGTSQNIVVLNFTGWGDVNTTGSATGSLRYQIVQTGTSATTYASAMMSSWATTDSSETTGVRYNFPLVYSINNIAPGTYTFTLELRREGEFGAEPTAFKLYGVQSKADVFIKE